MKISTLYGFDCCHSPNMFISPGYDVAGPVAIGLTHWKNPYVQGRPTLPSDLPLFVSKDAGIPVYHRSFTRKTDQATPLSCPASLSITPVPSYSSSSQETLSQDTTGKCWLPVGDSGLGVYKIPSCICLLNKLHLYFCLCDVMDPNNTSMFIQAFLFNEMGSHFVVQAGIELLASSNPSHLSLLSSWDYRHAHHHAQLSLAFNSFAIPEGRLNVYRNI